MILDPDTADLKTFRSHPPKLPPGGTFTPTSYTARNAEGKAVHRRRSVVRQESRRADRKRRKLSPRQQRKLERAARRAEREERDA